jgi:hypothetical protein
LIRDYGKALKDPMEEGQITLLPWIFSSLGGKEKRR